MATITTKNSTIATICTSSSRIGTSVKLRSVSNVSSVLSTRLRISPPALSRSLRSTSKLACASSRIDTSKRLTGSSSTQAVVTSCPGNTAANDSNIVASAMYPVNTGPISGNRTMPSKGAGCDSHSGASASIRSITPTSVA